MITLWCLSSNPSTFNKSTSFIIPSAGTYETVTNKNVQIKPKRNTNISTPRVLELIGVGSKTAVATAVSCQRLQPFRNFLLSLHTKQTNHKDYRLKVRTALYGNPSQSYGASLATWHHTVLHATRHKWTRPALTPASHAGTQFTYPGGMEPWLSWPRQLHSGPTRNRTLTIWSEVQCPNRYTTQVSKLHSYYVLLHLVHYVSKAKTEEHIHPQSCKGLVTPPSECLLSAVKKN